MTGPHPSPGDSVVVTVVIAPLPAGTNAPPAPGDGAFPVLLVVALAVVAALLLVGMLLARRRRAQAGGAAEL